MKEKIRSFSLNADAKEKEKGLRETSKVSLELSCRVYKPKVYLNSLPKIESRNPTGACNHAIKGKHTKLKEYSLNQVEHA